MPIPVRDLPDDIAVLKRMVMERDESLAAHIIELGDAKAQVEHLKLQLAKLRRQQFGRSSEKLDAQIAQLELALDGLEVGQAAREAEREAGRQAKAGHEPRPRPEKRKPARKPLPAHLPRETINHEGPCACSNCGGKLSKIGEDATEILEVEKTYRVIRHVRPRLSCRKCETITQAELPDMPITRGIAGPGLLAHVLISKYCDHLPLYRQALIFARDGIDLDRSTLCEWVGKCSTLLRPLVDELAKHVLAGPVIHGDDTPVPMLDPGRGKTREGRLWVYVRDERPWAGQAPPGAVYYWSGDRKGEHPQAHLKSFSGTLQADAYAGFNALYQTGRIHEAACWAHVRRKFFDVHKADKSVIAQEALARIAEFYVVEAAIRGQSAPARQACRLAQSAPKLEAMKLWAEETLPKLSGKSELAKAFRYMTTRWKSLTRFVSDGQIAIDNNPAERAMRAPALGRKNYLFVGPANAGERTADIYSLIETAKLNGLNPEHYLRDVLACINAHSQLRLAELLPWNWNQQNQRQETLAA
jgi:transposase